MVQSWFANRLPVCRMSRVLIYMVLRTMRYMKRPVVNCKQMWQPIDRNRKWTIDRNRKWPTDQHHKRPTDQHYKQPTDRHCKWVTGSHKSWPDRRYKPPKSAGRRKLELASIRKLVAAGRTAGWWAPLRHRWKQPPAPRRIDRLRSEPLRRIGKPQRLLVLPPHRNLRPEHNRRRKNHNH